jgi:hypothetical protein
MDNIKTTLAKPAEQDDVTTCGICSEPFKNGEVAVQAARWCNPLLGAPGTGPISEKFWAHPMCLFSISWEAEGPASHVAAMPPEPPDEELREKRKPK